MDHEERANELEREAEKLEQHTEHVGGQIEGVRRDWESKQQDQDVPGAQSHEALHPDEDEGDAMEATQDEAPGVRDSDEDREVGEE